MILIKWCGFTQIVSLMFATISCDQKICENSISVCIDGHLYLKKYNGLKKWWHFKIRRPYPGLWGPTLPGLCLPAHLISYLLCLFIILWLHWLAFCLLNLLNLFFSQFYFLLFPLPGIFPLQLFTSQVHIFFSVGSVLSALASDSLLFWFLSGWFSLFYFLLFLIM